MRNLRREESAVRPANSTGLPANIQVIFRKHSHLSNFFPNLASLSKSLIGRIGFKDKQQG